MVVTGTVVDEIDSKPLPGASVLIVDKNANPLGPGIDADQDGQFYGDDAELLNNYLLFSHVGYMSVLAPSSLFNAMDYPEVALRVTPKTLEEVIIRPPGKKENKWLWWGGGLLLIILLAGSKRRKKVGSIGANDWKDLAIKAGIAVGAYYLIIRPILIKLGILDSQEDKQVKADRDKAIAEAAAEEIKKNPPTLSEGVLSSMADTLFESMRYSWIDDDYDKTEDTLMAVGNTSDVYRIIQLFGVRQECLFGVICSDLTLPEMVKRNLSSSRILRINQHYASKGIRYVW